MSLEQFAFVCVQAFTTRCQVCRGTAPPCPYKSRSYPYEIRYKIFSLYAPRQFPRPLGERARMRDFCKYVTFARPGSPDRATPCATVGLSSSACYRRVRRPATAKPLVRKRTLHTKTAAYLMSAKALSIAA